MAKDYQMKKDMLRGRHPPSPCYNCHYLRGCDHYLDSYKNTMNCQVKKDEWEHQKEVKRENDEREETDDYYAEKMAHDRGELRKKKDSVPKIGLSMSKRALDRIHMIYGVPSTIAKNDEKLLIKYRKKKSVKKSKRKVCKCK